MATIIVENGSIVANANSYVSEAELTTYATDRGITLTGTANQLLITAMDYIEQQNFKGNKLTKDQSLQWPRYNVWIDGFPVDDDEIPTLLKESQMEAALAVDSGNSPTSTVEQTVKREKLDVMEVEYMDGSTSVPFNRALEAKLTKLINGSAFGINANAIRA